MELWRRFTDRARRAVLLAHSEAAKSLNDVIDTEHLLVGLLRLPESSAMQALRALDIDTDAVLHDVEEQLVEGRSEGERGDEITFTDNAQKALQHTYTESRNLGDSHVRTAHMLLGLLAIAEGAAHRVLSAHGMELKELRREVRTLSDNEGSLEQLQIEQQMQQKLPFEEALERLEQIVEKLDEGDLPLEESIELFKEGMELKDSCLKQLTEAEAVVEEYTEHGERDQSERAEDAGAPPEPDEEQ